MDAGCTQTAGEQGVPGMIIVTLTVERASGERFTRTQEIPEHLLLSVVRDVALEYFRQRAEQITNLPLRRE